MTSTSNTIRRFADVSKLHIDCNIEGPDTGYRWYGRENLTPPFAFGHGLSYTRCVYDDLKVRGDKTLYVSLHVSNSGRVAGRDTPHPGAMGRTG